ncbi:hypothetical protein [Oceanithermus sp.]
MVMLALVGCNSEGWSRQGRVWVFAQAQGDDLRMDIHLEAPDGSVPAGARVWLTDPGGGVRLVGFDGHSQSYQFEGTVLRGIWRVEIDSLAAGQLGLSVPVEPIANAPQIVSVQDGLGHRAENYEQLVASTPIRVEWRTVAGAEVYLLEVMVSGTVVQSVQTGEGFYVLPANSIPASSEGTRVSLRVTASSTHGDLYFSKGYYSVSSMESRTFSFEAAP